MFVSLTSAHTGAYLAEKVIECLKAYGIEEKVNILSRRCYIRLALIVAQVLAVTCDNAESNTVMLKEMKKLVPQFRSTQVR